MADRSLPFSTFVLISLFGLSIAAAQNEPRPPASSGPPPADQATVPSDRANQPTAPREPVEPSAGAPGSGFPADPVPPNNSAVVPPRESVPPRQRPPRTTAPAPPRRMRGTASDRSGVSLSAVVHKPVGVYDARELVLAGHVPAAKTVLDTLGKRYPADARVPYLRYILQSHTEQPKEALASLEHAIALQYYRPVGDYWRFMEPIQGPARFYAEQVRASVTRLESLGKLEVPPFEEIIAPRHEHASKAKKQDAKAETEQESTQKNDGAEGETN